MILDSSDLNLVNKVSFGAMTKKAKGQEEIQERVALLLRAQLRRSVTSMVQN